MTAFKSIDSKKEEFRKYLEKAGVMEVITKVLVGLYEEQEKPENAVEYVRKFLLGKTPESVELEALRMELCELKDKYSLLYAEHVATVNRLAKYEMPEAAHTSTTPPAVVANSPPHQEIPDKKPPSPIVVDPKIENSISEHDATN